MIRAILMSLALAIALAGPAAAVQPDEVLDDPALEQRAREISEELRCLVCQNQSIDDSNAPLARDLRILVRDRLQAGDSNGEVLDYVVARYGEFVLLQPRFGLQTALLWAAPAILLLIGGTGAVLLFRRRRDAEPPAPLTDDERRRIDELLDRPG